MPYLLNSQIPRFKGHQPEFGGSLIIEPKVTDRSIQNVNNPVANLSIGKAPASVKPVSQFKVIGVNACVGGGLHPSAFDSMKSVSFGKRKGKEDRNVRLKIN